MSVEEGKKDVLFDQKWEILIAETKPLQSNIDSAVMFTEQRMAVYHWRIYFKKLFLSEPIVSLTHPVY